MAEGSSAREFLKRAADQIRGFSKGFSEARQSISTDNFEAPTDTQEQIMEHGDTRAPAQKDAKGEALEKIHKFAPFKDIRFNIPKIQTGNPNLDQAFNESQSNIIAVLKTSYTEITSKLGFVYSQVQTLDRNIQRVDRQLDTLNIPTKIRDLSDRISQLERKRDNQIKFSDFSNVDRNALSELQKELNELKKRQNDSDSNWKSIAAGGAGAAGAGYGAKKAVDATRGKPRPSTTTKSPQPRDEKGRFMKQGTAAAEEAGESILKRGAKGIGRKLGPLGVAGITGWEFYDQYGQTGSYGEATAGTIGSTFGSMIDMVTPGSSDWNEQFMSHWAKKGYNWLAGDDEEAQEQRGEFNDVDIEKIEIKLTAKERMFLTARKELMLKADVIRLEARDIILDGKVHMPGMYPKNQARLGDDQAQDEGSWWSNAVSALMQGGPMAAGRSLGSSMFGGSRGGGGGGSSGSSSVSEPELSPERKAIMDEFKETGSISEEQMKTLGWIDSSGKPTQYMPEGFSRSVVPGSDGKKFEYKHDAGISNLSDEEVVKRFKSGHVDEGVTGDKASEQAMRFFIGKGYSKEDAAAIVGNLQTESGNFAADVISGQRRGDGGRAMGVAQWHPDRQANFRKQFGKSLSEATLQEQLEFVDWELNNTESKAKSRLLAAEGAAAKAAAVDQFYERSSGAHRGQRVSNANKLMKNDYDVFDLKPGEIPSPEKIQEMRKKLEENARGKVDFFRGMEGGYSSVIKAIDADNSVEQSQGRVAGIRKGPISTQLEDSLNYAAEQASKDGQRVIIDVTSGGQRMPGAPGATGSHRHDDGGAADFNAYILDEKTGKRTLLDPRNKEHQPILADLTRAFARAHPEAGVGAEYMSDPTKLHFGGPNHKGGGALAYAGDRWFTEAHGEGVGQRQIDLKNNLNVIDEWKTEKEKLKAEKEKQSSVEYNPEEPLIDPNKPLPLNQRGIGNLGRKTEEDQLTIVGDDGKPVSDGQGPIEINPVEAEFGNPEQGGDINIPELIGNTISGIGDAERLQQQVDQNMANFAYEPVLPMPDISSDVDAAVAEMQTDIASMPEFTAENIAPEYSDVGSLATSPTQDAALLQPDIEPPDIDPAEAPIEDPKSTTPSDEKPDAPNPKAQHGGEKDETGQGQPSKHHSATNKRAYPGDDAQGKHQSNPDGVDLCTV